MQTKYMYSVAMGMGYIRTHYLPSKYTYLCIKMAYNQVKKTEPSNGT